MPLQNFLHHTLGEPDRREAFLSGMPVIAVQIPSCQRTPIISYDHSVWVKHGNYFEYKPIAKFLKQEKHIQIKHKD